MEINQKVLDKMISLRAEGKTQQQIGDEVGLTQPQVSLALRSVVLPTIETAPTLPQVHLVARNPQEMANAQANLDVFFERKILSIAAEVGELSGALDEAIQNGWKSDALDRQHKRALQRKLFYEKCLTATRAGYTIIPDIPIDIFAIRTARSKPRPNERYSESSNYTPNASVPDEEPQILPPGEGSYRNPEQRVRNESGSYKVV